MLSAKKLLRFAGVLLLPYTTGGCGVELGNLIAAVGEASVVVERLDFDNVVPGRGYDLVTDSASDFCLTSTDAIPIEGTDGQEVVFGLQLIEDSKSLAKAMEISAAASIKFGFFGGEVKAKFVEQTEMSQTSVYALASVRVRNAPRVVRNTVQKEDAWRTLARNATRFRERCGDGFVSSIRTGGEFFGIIEISTSTEREKQELTSSIKGGGMTWSAEAAFSRAINSTVANKNVKVHTIQSGGLGHEDAPCMDVACLLERARNLPDMVTRHPVLISASVLPYRKLAFPEEATQTPIDTQIQLEIEADLVATRMDLRDLRAHYIYSLIHINQFVDISRENVEAAIRTCDGGINAINKNALACFRDINLCQMPEIVFPSVPAPRRKGPCEIAVVLCKEGRFGDIDDWQALCAESGGTPINLSTCS